MTAANAASNPTGVDLVRREPDAVGAGRLSQGGEREVEVVRREVVVDVAAAGLEERPRGRRVVAEDAADRPRRALGREAVQQGLVGRVRPPLEEAVQPHVAVPADVVGARDLRRGQPDRLLARDVGAVARRPLDEGRVGRRGRTDPDALDALAAPRPRVDGLVEARKGRAAVFPRQRRALRGVRLDDAGDVRLERLVELAAAQLAHAAAAHDADAHARRRRRGRGERGLQRGAARRRFRRDAHDLAGECVTQAAASEESCSGCSQAK